MKKSSLMFLYTNKCTAQCRHCCVEAGPQRTEKLSPELIKPLLSGFYDYGIREICFSGGEPLLFIDELEEISEEIKRIGFRQTVMTNAFWANSSAKARQYALRLKSMGIEKVSLSTSKFHIEYIDFTNIRIAAEALTEEGITVTIGLNHDKEKNIPSSGK